MKRRVLALFLTLTMLFSMNTAALSVFAASNPTISIEKKDAYVGDDVSIVVAIENNPGIWGMDLRVSYDKTAMTLISVDNGTFFKSSEWTKGNLNADVYTLSYEADDLDDITTPSGTLATLNFKIKEDAAPGTYAVNASYKAGDIINISFDDIDFTVSNGSITVANKPVSVTGVALDKSVATVKTGNTVTLTPIFSPNTATNKNVTWGSSDEAVATVSEGVVTGVEKGTAVITVTTDDGNFTASCTVTVECSHTNTTVHPAEASTCIKQGHAEYYTCDDCGAITSGSNELLPLGNHTGGTATCKDKAVCEVCHQPYGDYGSHSLTVHDRVKPDHFNAGNIQYWTCDICNKYFSDFGGNAEITQEDIVLTVVPHSYPDTWVKDSTQHWKECGCGNKIEVANHEYDNSCDTVCNVCGYERTITHSYSATWSTDGTNHWHECSVCHDRTDVGTHSGGAATCMAKAVCETCGASYGDYSTHDLTHHARVEANHFQAGNIEYWTCDTCGKYFSDSDGNTEITQNDTVIAKIEHSYSDDWSMNDSKHWKECSCGDKISESDHEYVNACDTTCNVCGYERSITHSFSETWSTNGTSHWHECSVCHEKKDVGMHNGGTATCKTKAVCETCGASYGNYGEHNYSEIVNTDCLKSVATCVSPALYYTSCSVCGAKSSETFTYGSVDKTNHVEGRYTVGQKEASCYEEGYTGDIYCSGCDTKLEAGTAIGKNDHNPASVWSTDANFHWKECQTIGCGNLIDKAAHSGGTATCTEKAVCEVCGVKYGTVDSNNHIHTEIRNKKAATEDEEGYTGDTYCLDCQKTVQTGEPITKLDHTHNLTATTAKESTCTAEGNIAYWYCTKCHKYYSDANGIDEITLEDTVTEKKSHSFTVLEHDDTNHWYKCANCDATTGTEAHRGGTATCKDTAVCEKCLTAYGTLASHIYIEKAETQYLISEATCISPAVYSKSCSVCGIKGTETFESGSVDKNNHVDGRYTVGQKEATCYEEGYTGDIYCSGCNTKVETGTPISKGTHNPADVWTTDETHHWKICVNVGCGNIIDKAEHCGGEATCTEQAVCEVCGVKYGELNANNHKNTKTINAKTPGCTEKGYTGDTYCNDCKKIIMTGTDIVPIGHTPSEWKTDEKDHWKICSVEGCGAEIADSRAAHTESEWIVDKVATTTENGSKHIECSVCKKVIKTETIDKLISYVITDGANSVWFENTGSLTFKSNASFEKFESVKVDGTVIAENNYNVSEGSTVVTLKESYVKTLSVGKHTMTIVSIDGEASTEFEIRNTQKPTSPQTGDNSNLTLWLSLMLLSCCGLVATIVIPKRRSIR